MSLFSSQSMQVRTHLFQEAATDEDVLLRVPWFHLPAVNIRVFVPWLGTAVLVVVLR
jgi:hypothetical protein